MRAHNQVQTMKKKSIIILFAGVAAAFVAIAASRYSKGTTVDEEVQTETAAVGPQFSEDSAYAFCAAQCQFGPRVMNSKAHDDCAAWIVKKFRQYGMDVIEQKAELLGWDKRILHNNNIIAQYRPDVKDRIMICAHWDSRPWADNDPDEANHHTPVMAANDGASGVAVMLELARLISQNDSLDLGIDFICFDTEDYGVPQWSDSSYDGDSWAMGAQYWSKHLHREDYTARFGILLDMVGGEGARFYQETGSMQYAPEVVSKVWNAAQAAGYATVFPFTMGGGVVDDHVPVNENAGIPCIDIINYYPDCEQSSFGPVWHTIHDTMDHIDRNTLKAVGQTLVQVIYSE